MKYGKHYQALITGPDDTGRRLDRVLRKALPDYSLSLIHRLLRQGKAFLNGKPASPADRVPPKSVIQIVIRGERTENREQRTVNKGQGTGGRGQREGGASNYDPRSLILWRGSGIIVFNKPPGLATHGENSLDTAVKAWLYGKLPPSLSFQPGPLHRLDKPTSGAVAFSETLDGARLFSRLLREREVAKTYLAIVEGRISGETAWKDGLVRDSYAGKTYSAERDSPGFAKAKSALTAVKALASNGSHTILEARIVTGRTHQIRAQAAAHGHPLAGDVKYGGRGGGFFLHAWKLDADGYISGFPRPLVAPLPAPFQARIASLFDEELTANLTNAANS